MGEELIIGFRLRALQLCHTGLNIISISEFSLKLYSETSSSSIEYLKNLLKEGRGRKEENFEFIPPEKKSRPTCLS